MNELGVIYRRTERQGVRGPVRPMTRRPRIARATPSWSAPRARSTAAFSGSRQPTSSGCWRWAKRSGWVSTTWASASTGVPTRSASATSCIGSIGSEDDQIAEGASFAVENWAAAGFWQELEDGLLHIKATRLPDSESRLLHLAQPRRGPARRPHDGRARRGLLRPRVRPSAVLPGRARSPRRHRRLLGRPGRRPAARRDRLSRT